MTISVAAGFFFAASTVAKSMEEEVAAKARAIKPGRRVEVTLVSGETVKGNMGTSPNPNHLRLETAKDGTKEIAISDVRSVKSKMNLKEKWAVGLAIYGAVMLLVALTLGG